MAEENTSTETTETVETTAEQSSVETQSTETQSSEQVDTTQSESTVNESLAIESKEESGETEESTLPSIDDIVAEAMTGEISEETQKIIEANGLGKHLDMLVAGHQAIQTKNDQSVFEVVGGEKQYSELQEWGLENMSTEKQEAFNQALFSGNMDLAKLAVQGLQAEYVAANGKSPDRVLDGGGSANAESRPFESQAEYIREATSFKYKSDPEYARSIEAKRNKSGF